MIKNYKHVVWDWNGTILCDVELGIEIMNGLLQQRRLALLTPASYRDLFTMPVQHYYARLGFDFAREPFEIVGKLWMVLLATPFVAYLRRRDERLGLKPA